MQLSDGDLLDRMESGNLVIDPLDNPELQIQPASIDVRLGTEFLKFNPRDVTSINPLKDNPEDFMEKVVIEEDETFFIHPGDFVLASTKEWVEVPEDLIGFVDGRSTFGRLGLVIHATAGLLDPGFKGNVTLEMSNLGKVPIELTPNSRIGQLTFTDLKNPAERPYGVDRGSKYQNQTGVQSARSDYTTDETPGRQDTLENIASSENSSEEERNEKIGFN